LVVDAIRTIVSAPNAVLAPGPSKASVPRAEPVDEPAPIRAQPVDEEAPAPRAVPQALPVDEDEGL